MDSPVLRKDCLQALLARDEEMRELRRLKDLEIAGLREQVADHERSFDLRWKADMRAIKRWQEAHPGNDLVWPDHADLCVWLMEQVEQLRKVIGVTIGCLDLNRRLYPMTVTLNELIGKLRCALEAK